MFSIEGMSYRYGLKDVFKDCHAQIPGGTLVYGPNGCGKTTLLKLLGGILTPQEGKILWNDKPKYRSSVLLSHSLLYDDIPLERQLAWICSLTGKDKSWLHARIDPFAPGALLSYRPSEMSFGMRQWATIAFVCAMPSDVYLMDEPFLSLDEYRRCRLLEILRRRSESGDSFVLTGQCGDAATGAPWLQTARCPA